MNMRAYLQLVRVPNVFTAMADIFLGFLFTHERLEPWGQFALLLLASSLLYMAGMVLNDYFDRHQDAPERPERPIPSGRVSAQAALRLGWAMLALGTALGWVASIVAGDARPAVVATILAAAVLAYDVRLKRSLAGPIVMGACRTLNVLLGMSVADDAWQPVHWVVAGGVGLYIVGVTLFARTEARTSARPRLAVGLVILLAAIGLLASIPEWASGDEWPPVRAPQRWLVFWILIGLLIAWRSVRAVINPRPAYVQLAVRNCIFALVVLDAAAVLAVQDRFWALAILALLLPTIVLGQWIYST
jgi:4-hydroxybenzoate polyprenyltransferase